MLNREFLPATRSGGQPLVLLHGWASGPDIWRPLLARLRSWADVTLIELPGCAPQWHGDAMAFEVLVREALAAAPPQAVYVGWSLGGQLAMELASREPERVRAVVTLCSNPRFVAGNGWPGMAPAEFEDFRAAFMAEPRAALTRFDSLQVSGADASRALLRQLRRSRPGAGCAALEAGLNWLGCLDQRDTWSRVPVPALHLYAQRDALVPPECADRLRAIATGEVRTLQARGHLVPLAAPDELQVQLRGFLENRGLLQVSKYQQPLFDKRDVAQSFSRAAIDYDSVALLQRDVGARLLDQLVPPNGSTSRVLDLGCGTGHFQPALAARFPQAEYIGLDLAAGMVEFARQQCPGAGSWLVGDAESLPLAANSVDLVFSSLTVQWCHRPELLFAELERVLRPGGCCVFTSLGPGTLRELRSAWAAVDEHQHVNTFLPAAALEQAAGQLPGVRLSLITEQFVMRYRRVRDLLNELKTLGAHNMNRQRASGLTGRRALQGMLDAYEQWREGDTLPATYDVLFGVLEKA